jgi:hypothetical protein
VAIDDLPLPVVNFLNVIGVPWPNVDEDQLVEFARLEPLFARVEEMIAAMDWSQTGSVRVEPATGVSLDPQALAHFVAVLRNHADTMEAHGEQYTRAVLALDF